MADGQLIIDIQANTENVEKGLSKVNKSIETTEQTAKNASGGVGGLGGALGGLINPVGLAVAGIGGLGAGILAATKAASDEQVGIDRLGATLSANIPNFKGNENAAEGFVSKMEGLAFSDDAARDSLNKLVPRTHDLAEAQNLSALAADLARAKNIDLSTATDIVGKVYSGNVGVLGRYGIAVDKGATSTEALAAIQKMAGGQAQTYADSAAGSMDKLQVAFGDATETIGHEFLPIITNALGGVANFIQSPAFQQGFQAFADFLGSAIPQAIGFVTPIISGLFNFLQNTALPVVVNIANFLKDNAVPVLIMVGAIILSQVVPAFIAWGTTMLTETLPALFATASATLAAMAPFLLIGAVVAGLFIAFQTNFLGIGDVVKSVWFIVQPILQPFIDAIQTFISTVTGGGDIGAAVGKLFGDLGAAIQSAGPKIGPALHEIGNLLWAWIQDAVPQVMNALGSLLGSILGWIQANGPGILAQLSQWAVGFAQWVWNDAIPALLSALGGLIAALWGWIQANGPGILAQLGVWAQQFGAWVWNTAIPALLQALGGLLSALWNWITTNGPGILTQLATWAAAFGGWVLGTAVPWMLEQLGSLIGTLWNWIVDNGPGILTQLLTWAAQFRDWIMTNVVPNIPIWLGNIAQALWTFITDNAPKLLTQLGQWKDQFFNWVMTSVLPNIPIWLGNLASALWTWITQTATDLGSHLVNEWIPAFWNWLTGKGGVKDTIGSKLDEAWTGFTTWVTGMVTSIPGTLAGIGGAIVSGIREGIVGGWQAFTTWLGNLVGGLINAVKAMLGISSPSKVMADEVGAPLAQGIQKGFEAAWPAVQSGIVDKILALQKQAQQTAGNPAYAPGSPAAGLPAYQPQNPAYLPGGGQTGGNPAYLPGEPAYRNPAYDPQNPAYLPGGGQTGGNPAYAPPGDHAGSGGQSARAFSSGFGGGSLSGGGTTNLYLSIAGGPWMTPQQASQKLSVRTRLTEVRT